LWTTVIMRIRRGWGGCQRPKHPLHSCLGCGIMRAGLTRPARLPAQSASLKARDSPGSLQSRPIERIGQGLLLARVRAWFANSGYKSFYGVPLASWVGWEMSVLSFIPTKARPWVFTELSAGHVGEKIGGLRSQQEVSQRGKRWRPAPGQAFQRSAGEFDHGGATAGRLSCCANGQQTYADILDRTSSNSARWPFCKTDIPAECCGLARTNRRQWA